MKFQSIYFIKYPSVLVNKGLNQHSMISNCKYIENALIALSIMDQSIFIENIYLSIEI
ncbi:hypothetical protein VCRA2128O105_70006 [Vibrio crassostreae]|nr:hypothetical protein VCRA2128O100_170091 [Vibrio crassostreae]CAK3247681.1 hypothetical protein VCRA2128O107_170006 [Vibrio crassostreae]CAK3266573.1 hypothetical protein VCRA2126O88_180090 [Vibrio crassostreae]CAK3273031.1 hypothetical protein VCRA2126O87_180091 [Vibrio crassostreae]CAK3315754.1 hypothetical protein VCRA2128O109_170090 [Vibrio crassostreae]